MPRDDQEDGHKHNPLNNCSKRFSNLIKDCYNDIYTFTVSQPVKHNRKHNIADLAPKDFFLFLNLK